MRVSHVERLELAAEIGKRRESAKVSLLQHILCLAIVSHHAPRHPVETTVVPLHQRACGRPVFSQNEAN